MQVARPENPELKRLLERFVCVRVIKGNSLDLSLFQFDYDLTFAAMIMNADRSVYGRYGTRSSLEKPESDISMQGLTEALTGALELHAKFPAIRESLAAKQGKTPRHPIPELYPALKKFTPLLNYGGKVAGSCIHCHTIKAAEIDTLRAQGAPFPEKILYPWPLPASIGLRVSTSERGLVLKAAPSSPAQRAGFRRGDRLLTLQGQPIISIADIQWVLHNAPSPAKLAAVVTRAGVNTQLVLDLDEGWRRNNDISWRASAWPLRRMGLGGMVLEDLKDAGRKKRGLDGMALWVKHVGQYGQHRTAKDAGFRKGDIVVELDGIRKRLSETEILAHILRKRKPGDSIPVKILRGGRRKLLRLPIK